MQHGVERYLHKVLINFAKRLLQYLMKYSVKDLFKLFWTQMLKKKQNWDFLCMHRNNFVLY